MTREVDSSQPTLSFLCTRKICTHLFATNIRWRRLSDFAYAMQEWLRTVRMAPLIRGFIDQGIEQVIREVQRWAEKHCEMFADTDPKRTQRGDHLRMYFPRLCWKASEISVDDCETARNIIQFECADWPQMRFQFASAYALLEVLRQFDHLRLRTFKKRLSGHPLYDFWLGLLLDERAWERMINENNNNNNNNNNNENILAPRQMVSLLFQWAIVNGYCEMVRFLHQKTTPEHSEYIGLLQWHKVCFQAKHADVTRFLCSELCQVNAVGLARITWNTFYGALHSTLNSSTEELTEDERQANLRKLEFLLANCCPTLRAALLAAEDYRGLTDAFLYKDNHTFGLFLEHLTPDQLKQARRRIDTIYRRKSQNGDNDDLKWFRRILMKRQATIE